MILGTIISQFPISSTSNMVDNYNGEIFHITLSVQPIVDITLNLLEE